MKKHFIYFLIEPRKNHKFYNKIRYVGITNTTLNNKTPEKRLTEHFFESIKSKTHKANWLTCLKIKNKQPILIYTELNSLQNCKCLEIFFIDIFRKILPKNCLLNISNGGECTDTFTNNPNKEQIRNKFKVSTNNLYNSKEGKKVKEKISKSLKIFYNSKNGNKTKIIKSEKIKKYFKTKKGKEHLKILSKTHKNKKRSKEECLKQSISISGEKNHFFGKKHSKKSKKKMSKSKKNKGLKTLKIYFNNGKNEIFLGINLFLKKFNISKYYFEKLIKGIKIKKLPDIKKIELIP